MSMPAGDGWPYEDFGRYVDAKMAEVGMVRDSELAAASGVDASLISKWRAGKTQPSHKSLRRLAPSLRVTPKMLFMAAGLDDPDDSDVAAVEVQSWPAPFHQLRQVYDRMAAIGRADVAARDIARLVAGLRAELEELESPQPSGRRRVG